MIIKIKTVICSFLNICEPEYWITIMILLTDIRVGQSSDFAWVLFCPNCSKAISQSVNQVVDWSVGQSVN